jgi:hypothetical protein
LWLSPPQLTGVGWEACRAVGRGTGNEARAGGRGTVSGRADGVGSCCGRRPRDFRMCTKQVAWLGAAARDRVADLTNRSLIDDCNLGG